MATGSREKKKKVGQKDCSVLLHTRDKWIISSLCKEAGKKKKGRTVMNELQLNELNHLARTLPLQTSERTLVFQVTRSPRSELFGRQGISTVDGRRLVSASARSNVAGRFAEGE